jgi:hypothetical protein
MAQDGARAAREYRAHPVSMPRQEPMSDGVDASMDGAKPAELESVIDRIRPKAKL